MGDSKVKTRPLTDRPELELVTGPAGSGKTDWCLERAAELLKRTRRVMVVLPTSRAVADFKLRLLTDRDFSVVWRPEILTFGTLGREILRASRPGLKRIGSVAQEIILAEVVALLHKQVQVPVLWALSGFLGLVPALREWIAELKRAEVTPEAFADFARSPSASTKDVELAAIYAEYQDQLHKLKVYDPEGQFWHAKEILDQGSTDPIVGLDAVLVDGFYDFTPMELSVLELIGRAGSSLSMTLVHDRDDHRPDLFERPARTLDKLSNLFAIKVRTLKPTDDRAAQLRHLERNLFAQRSAPCPGDVAPAVRFIETPGDLIEVEQIARTIKGELIPEGFRPEDICIITRTPVQYAAVAADVFRRTGIPYHLAKESPLAGTPVGRLALQILDVVTGDFRLNQLGSLLRSSLLDLSPVMPGGAGLAHSVQDVCIEAGIVGGRKNFMPRLKTLAKRLEDRLEHLAQTDEGNARYIDRQEFECRITLTEDVGKLLEAVFEGFKPLLEAKTFADVAEALVKLMTDLGVHKTLCGGQSGQPDVLNLRAYELLLETLDELVLTAELVGLKRCKLLEFSRHVRRMMGEKVLSSPTPREVGVSILSVHEARALSFPVVFVCGLLDRTFPRAHREGPFHDDAERTHMERFGLNLRPRRAEQSEESLLFYLACTRATQRLTLTYPVTDREGTERLVSHYVDEVIKVIGESARDATRRIRLADRVPSTSEVASLSELRRRTLVELCTHGSPDMKTLKPMLDTLRRTMPVAFELMGSGLIAEAERQSFRPFGRFDGVLSKDLIGKELRQHHGPEYPFSVSALENYGTCPFRFFARQVLGLVEPATLEEELTPLELGSLYHDVLWEFFHTLRSQTPEATVLEVGRLEDYIALIEGILERRMNRLKGGRDDLHPALWKLTTERVRQTLRSFLDAQIALLSGSSRRRPSHFEVSFGLRRRRGVSDELSTTERFVLDCADEQAVSLAGKIDRIDLLGENGDAFVVMDYKSGKSLPSRKDILLGTSLQLPLYVLAAEEVIFKGTKSTATSAEACGLTEKKPRPLLVRPTGTDADKAADDAKWGELIETATGFVTEYVGGIRRGQFPVFIRDERSCPAHCEFRQVCRYSERRALKKARGWKPWFHHPKGESKTAEK